MNTFPTISRNPGVSGYNFDKSSDAILVANRASGLPVLNKIWTFDPIIFSFKLNLVSDTDKNTIMDFYEANKDVPFYWYNNQDSITYEVIFTRPVRCSLDKIKTRWQISIELQQYSSTVT